MLLIQIDGTPTAAAAPASIARIRRRVTAITTGGIERKTWGVIWRAPLDLEPAAGQQYAHESRHRLKLSLLQYLATVSETISDQFVLDFHPFRAFNPATFSERRSFRPAARSMRPEANARQRDAPSGAKVFGISFWRLAPGHI